MPTQKFIFVEPIWKGKVPSTKPWLKRTSSEASNSTISSASHKHSRIHIRDFQNSRPICKSKEHQVKVGVQLESEASWMKSRRQKKRPPSDNFRMWNHQIGISRKIVALWAKAAKCRRTLTKCKPLQMAHLTQSKTWPSLDTQAHLRDTTTRRRVKIRWASSRTASESGAQSCQAQAIAHSSNNK